jgi:hypothetical protein
MADFKTIEECDAVIARFDGGDSLVGREETAWALVNKAWLLYDQARREDALAACDDLLTRFGLDTEVGVREAVARGLNFKGAVLEMLHRLPDAIGALSALLSHFHEGESAVIDDVIAQARARLSKLLNGNPWHSAIA